jgi:hypothetical protein
MQTRLLFNLLPCQALDSVRRDAPVCLAAFRGAQVADDDLLEEQVGEHQKAAIRKFASGGEGTSLLIASSPADVVLVRAFQDEARDARLRKDLTLLSEHLQRCGITPGRPELVADLEAALPAYLPSHFICAATFGAALERAFGREPAASKHRHVIRVLDDKLASYRLLEEARLPVPRLFVLRRPQDVEEFIASARPPWVLKAAYGSGGEQVAVAMTASEVRSLWREGQAKWGQVLGEPYKTGQHDWFVYFVIDPAEPQPRFLMAGQMLTEGGRHRGNYWERRLEASFDLSGPKAVAAVHHQFAREQGASAFHEGQDWREEPWSYLETNPRMCAGTAITLYLARRPGAAERVLNMILPRSDTPLEELLERLRPIEATPERGEGVLLYSAGDSPRPHVLALLINDTQQRFETELRRLL